MFMPFGQMAPALNLNNRVPRLIGSLKPRNGSPVTRHIGSAAGTSYQGTFGLREHYDFVQLVFANDQTTVSQIDAVAVAASAKAGMNPVDSADVAQPWLRVTFNNGGVLHNAPSLTGSTFTLQVPAAAVANDLNPTLAVSDWMRLSSLDRADPGQSNPLLMVRAWTSGTAMRLPGAGTGAYSAADQYPAIDAGLLIQQGAQTGDFVTANQSTFVGATKNERLPVYGLRYMRRAGGVSSMNTGDSLDMGNATPGSANNWHHQACARLSSPLQPVTPVSAAWSGFTTAQFTAAARRHFDTFLPDIVCIKASSPNDNVSTMDAFNANWRLAMELADHVQRSGSVPVFVTAPAYINYDATEDMARKTLNDRMRAMGRAGARLVIDADLAISDGGSPARPLAAYIAGGPGELPDGGHYTSVGHAAIAAMAVPVLARAIAAS